MAPESAPASAPDAAPTAPSPEVSSPAPDTSFDNLGSADDLDSVEIPAETVAAPEQAAPPTQPGAPQPATAPAPAQAAQPTAPTPPQQAQPTAPAQATGEDYSSPQGLVQQLSQHRDAVLSALAADRFKLSQAEVTALDTDAVGAIPGIMARVYYEAMQSTLLQMQALVPKLVQQVIDVQRSHDEAEKGFYDKFPALTRGRVHNDVLSMAAMFRNMNPRITRDELFALVGAAVAAKHGVNLATPPANGGRPPQAPFVPARSGAHVKVIPEAENPWAGLGKDFDDVG